MHIARGLLAAAVPVTLLHAIVLELASTATVPIGGRDGNQVRPMLVRLERAHPPTAPSSTAASPRVSAAEHASEPPATTVITQRPGSTDESLARPSPVDPPVKATTPAVPETEAGSPLAATNYIPRALLTTPPRAIGVIDVPFPPEVIGDVRLTLQLTLFIDADGIVQSVRIDGPDSIPVLEEAARDTFMKARFSPGELNGHAVRSQVTIEITFESVAGPETEGSH